MIRLVRLAGSNLGHERSHGTALGTGLSPGSQNILHLPGNIWEWALGKKVGCNIIVTAATCAPIPCNDSVDIEHIPGAFVPISTPTYIVRPPFAAYNPKVHATISQQPIRAEPINGGHAAAARTSPHPNNKINPNTAISHPSIGRPLQHTPTNHQPVVPRPGQATTPAHRNLSTPWNCIATAPPPSPFRHATKRAHNLAIKLR